MRHPGIEAKSWVGLVVVFIAAVLGGCAGEKKLERFEFTRLEMGVRARVVLYARSGPEAERGAQGAFERIAGLDACMSDYRPQSELSRLSRTNLVQVPVSKDLFTVIAAALRVSEASGGAFDITVGPAVALWREMRKTGKAKLGFAGVVRERIGWRSVWLDDKNRTVTLGTRNMLLDLGGIAKGYAAQQAVLVLQHQGLNRCMVALAGDICVGDAPPGEEGWKIDVRPPTPVPGRDVDVYLHATLILANASVSTSGDSEQFVEIDGRRYSHIIDPRTALPVTTSIQATVVGRDGAIVDAAATALSVLGPSKAAEVSESLGVSSVVSEGGAVVVSDKGGRLRW
jgi:thiamine biosynthesis lipoprotein